MMAFLYHLRMIFYRQRWVLLLTMLFTGIMQILYAYILATSELRLFMESLYQVMPGFIKQVSGLIGETFSGKQFLAFGFGHPSVLLLLSSIGIAAFSGHITAEIETRGIELLANRVLPRPKLLLAVQVYVMIAVLLTFAVMLLGSYIGKVLSGLDEPMPVQSLLVIAAVGWFFFTAVGAIVMLVAVLNSYRGRTIGWSAGILVVLFVLDAIIRIWPDIEFLQPWSLFGYYQPTQIGAGDYNFTRAFIYLGSLFAVFSAAAYGVFAKRDM